MPRCGALKLLSKKPNYRGVGEISARLNVKLCDLRGGDWWSHLTPFLAQSSSHGNQKPTGKLKAERFGSSEIVLFLREAMRAISSLGCEGAMRAIASSMSSNVSPQQGTTPIFSVAFAGGRTAVQTASAAAK